MKSLIIAAHGSSIPESNEEVRNLTEQVRNLAGDTFDLVQCAFLERTEPKVDEVIDNHVNQGVEELTLFPYLLASGRHVQTDIPRIIEDARDRHADLTIIQVPHLGRADGLAGLILKHVKS